MVHHIAMVMLLEFFVVHSAGFMGVVAASDQPRVRRLPLMLGLAGLYTVFTAAYSVDFGSWWMVGAFWSLMLNRLSSVAFGVAPPGDQQMFVGVSWAASVLFYLGSIFATVVPDLPGLGITPEVVARQGFRVGGAWSPAGRSISSRRAASRSRAACGSGSRGGGRADCSLYQVTRNVERDRVPVRDGAAAPARNEGGRVMDEGPFDRWGVALGR